MIRHSKRLFEKNNKGFIVVFDTDNAPGEFMRQQLENIDKCPEGRTKKWIANPHKEKFVRLMYTSFLYNERYNTKTMDKIIKVKKFVKVLIDKLDELLVQIGNDWGLVWAIKMRNDLLEIERINRVYKETCEEEYAEKYAKEHDTEYYIIDAKECQEIFT